MSKTINNSARSLKRLTHYKKPFGLRKRLPQKILSAVKEIRPEIDAPIEVWNIFGPLGMNTVVILSFLGGPIAWITIDFNTPTLVGYSHVKSQWLHSKQIGIVAGKNAILCSSTDENKHIHTGKRCWKFKQDETIIQD